jgi:hypothetical protein
MGNPPLLSSIVARTFAVVLITVFSRFSASSALVTLFISPLETLGQIYFDIAAGNHDLIEAIRSTVLKETPTHLFESYNVRGYPHGVRIARPAEWQIFFNRCVR